MARIARTDTTIVAGKFARHFASNIRHSLISFSLVNQNPTMLNIECVLTNS
jgi:hypothetical protein